MKIMLDLPDYLAANLHREAVTNGFKRENPRARWTEAEKKASIRAAIMWRLPA